MQSRRIIQVEEKVPLLQGIPLAFQHLFAMFGASVLVPYLFNSWAGAQVIDPSLVLLMNGIGTLIYLFLCKGRAPAFLGSSFAFLSPVAAVLASEGVAKENFAKALGGFIISGLVFVLVALLIGAVGTKWLDIVLPPATMGPIVALIGLELAGVAAGNAGLLPKTQLQIIDGVATSVALPLDGKAILVSLATLAVLVLGNLVFRGFLAIIPILIAVVFGYVLSATMGMVVWEPVATAQFLTFPSFTLPKFDISAIIIILPAALVVISEHIGHLFVTSKIVGRDLTKDPGLHRSLLGDGLSTMLSGFTGSVPTTTYGENMGVMAITGVYSVWGHRRRSPHLHPHGFLRKCVRVHLEYSGPGHGRHHPAACLGVIAASGIRMIVEAKVDYSKSQQPHSHGPDLCCRSQRRGREDPYGSSSREWRSPLCSAWALSLLFFALDKLGLTNDHDNGSEASAKKAA